MASRRTGLATSSALAVGVAVVIVVQLAAAVSAQTQCADFNSGVESSYWFVYSPFLLFCVTCKFGAHRVCGLLLVCRDSVRNCTGCATQPQCGYCLSTLQCVGGDDEGPADGMPCPDWVHMPADCPSTFSTTWCSSFVLCVFTSCASLCVVCCVVPVAPTCHEFSDCGLCAGVDDCAWCASEERCMEVGDILSSSCRSPVFDLPCPESYVGGTWTLELCCWGGDLALTALPPCCREPRCRQPHRGGGPTVRWWPPARVWESQQDFSPIPPHRG